MKRRGRMLRVLAAVGLLTVLAGTFFLTYRIVPARQP